MTWTDAPLHPGHISVRESTGAVYCVVRAVCCDGAGRGGVWLSVPSMPAKLTAHEALELAEELIAAAETVQRAEIPAPEVRESDFGEFASAAEARS